ncbi:hypothetical protein QA584_27825 [Anaerocolumna sp. AGMB13025]|uniref:hypothetical protein n=1 Tax=Anaerocolumna sp. AGMB13025 TaxID=3039116 RepID=UPI00241D6196|nr:hypothetical protein [Anaerocolumna sp. AGMB13025]WFR57371.1 hypothetical protein QA584_27825 [Anaerocolumna sp. AGMB13025]
MENKKTITKISLPVTKETGMFTRKREAKEDRQNGSSHWLLNIVGTLMLTTVCMLLSVFSPAAVKAYAAQVASPAAISADNYQTIEKADLHKQIDKFTKAYENYVENYKKVSQGMGSELTVRSEFDPTIAAALGLPDLKSVKADMVSMQNAKKVKSIITLFTNDIKFTSLNMISDLEKQLTYLLIPELSKAYLKADPKSTGLNSYGPGSNFTTKDFLDILNNPALTEKTLNQLLKRYADIVVSDLNDVSAMDYYMSAGGLSDQQTRYTVNVDEKVVLKIAKDVLAVASTDEELSDLFVKLNLCSKAEYTKMIAAAQNEVKEMINYVNMFEPEGLFTMRVWVDSDGTITGRDFSLATDKDNSLFGYKTVKKGEVTGMEAWISPDKETIFKLSSTTSKDNSGINGNAVITYATDKTSVEFKALIKDLKYTSFGSGYYLNGNLVITGESLPGSTLLVAFNGNETAQKIKADFVQGTLNLISVTIDTKILPYEDFDLPSESDTVYDMTTQMDTYFNKGDFVNYLKGINSKINVQGINKLLDQMIKSYLR